MKLHGKIALVTGAGRGIGRGCAVALAEAGADLVINDRPDSTDSRATAAEIEALGRHCAVAGADVFSRPGCQETLDQALAAFGRIDILVSNPAFGRRDDFLNYDPDDFERSIQGTLISGFHMAQLVARHMVSRKQGGKIVFISSVQAEMPLARSVAYNAAKLGLNHMMRTIAVELAEHRINVNAIEPGWIDTPGEEAAFGREQIEQQAARLPWGRLGTPRDIGNAAAFLSSDEADYITGTVLAVDGGFRFKDCRAASQPPPAST